MTTRAEAEQIRIDADLHALEDRQRTEIVAQIADGYAWLVADAARGGPAVPFVLTRSAERADPLVTPAAQPSAPAVQEEWSFQVRVASWLIACFGETIARDREERNHRFLEEALELVQSLGCSRSEAHQIVDYVFDRDVGEPKQESGGVMVTHAALCLANGMDMHENGETELARIWTKVDKIRAKQAAKPKHSPLPEHTPPGTTSPVADDAVIHPALMVDVQQHRDAAYQGGWDDGYAEGYGVAKSQTFSVASDAVAITGEMVDLALDEWPLYDSEGTSFADAQRHMRAALEAALRVSSKGER